MSHNDEEHIKVLEDQVEEGMAQVVQPEKDHFPLCIVWTPLPLLTWFVPFIGHVGITTSRGTIHDFAGSHYVNKHQHKMGFGRVTKYWRINLSDIHSSPLLQSIVQPAKVHPEDESVLLDSRSAVLNDENAIIQNWDDAVEFASGKYRYENHNLITNNCHAHVATALNRLHFKHINYWNTLLIMIYLMFYSKFVSFPRFLSTWLPFFIILGIVAAVVILFKFA